jgi:predicted CoA-binding protein
MSAPTVAIVGASADRRKFGNKSVRAHAARGYQVFPVNPRGGTVEGLPVYARLSDIPVRPLDRISVYLPPPAVLEILPQIAAVGCRQLWLNPGTESPEVLARARELGLPVIQGCSIVDLGVAPEDFPDA